MPPPITRLSITLSIFAIIEIFDETLAPPTIAVTGFLGDSKTFFKDKISFCNNNPGDFSVKYFAIVLVDACARCVVP